MDLTFKKVILLLFEFCRRVYLSLRPFMALWLKLAKLICQAKLTTKRVTGKQRTQAPLK